MFVCVERTMYNGKCLQNDILHSQMWIWEVHINTGVATKGHPNTENWEVKKNDGSSASAVPKVIRGHFPSESLRSVNMRRVQKIWTDELQQPIWRLLREEHLLVCQCRNNLGQELYKGAQRTWTKEKWNRSLWDRVRRVLPASLQSPR